MRIGVLVSLPIIRSSFAGQDLRRLRFRSRRARIADFHGGQGCENGHLESVRAVSPSDALPQGLLGLRELGSATATRSLQTIHQTPEIAATRSRLLGMPFPALAELALHAGHRAARNGHQLASHGIQAVLAVEIEGRKTWTSTHRSGNP